MNEPARQEARRAVGQLYHAGQVGNCLGVLPFHPVDKCAIEQRLGIALVRDNDGGEIRKSSSSLVRGEQCMRSDHAHLVQGRQLMQHPHTDVA
jgi:hypothetical protein